MALDRDRDVGIEFEEDVADGSGRLNAWQRLEPLERLLIVVNLLRCALRSWEFDLQCEQASRCESGVNVLDSQEATDQQASAGQ